MEGQEDAHKAVDVSANCARGGAARRRSCQQRARRLSTRGRPIGRSISSTVSGARRGREDLGERVEAPAGLSQLDGPVVGVLPLDLLARRKVSLAPDLRAHHSPVVAPGYDPGHTSLMKVAISIPDDIFRRVELAAKRRGISRSELLTEAAAAFLDEQYGREVTASYDPKYSVPTRRARCRMTTSAVSAGKPRDAPSSPWSGDAPWRDLVG